MDLRDILQPGRILSDADVDALRALLIATPAAPREAQKRRLAARDEAIRTAASLLPADNPTGLARELECKLARMARRRPTQTPPASDPLTAAACEVLIHNRGKPLRWRQLWNIICGLGRS